MYDQRAFTLRTVVSLLATGGLVMVLVMAGTTYAVPLGGIGGFSVIADEITADSAALYPGYGQTKTQEKANVIIVELRGVEITGLTLTKSLDTSSVPGISGDSEVVLDSKKPVSADQLVLKTTGITADRGRLNNAVITEQTSSNPSDSFLVSAGSASGSYEGQITSIDNNRQAAKLTNVELSGHYIAAGALTIPDLTLKVKNSTSAS
jgi:hypothetical protein